jgi:thiamine pyrophosphate-dependent acetolactate synthase large subunit-like protein
MGKSSYNEKDHLSLGMLGMHGTAYNAIMLLVVIALGARFDDRVTGKLQNSLVTPKLCILILMQRKFRKIDILN